jgi:hypothetical protein
MLTEDEEQVLVERPVLGGGIHQPDYSAAQYAVDAAIQQAQLAQMNSAKNVVYQTPNYARVSPAHIVRGQVGSLKARQQIDNAIEKMPMSLAVHIESITFHHKDSGAPAYFQVNFISGQTLMFDDIDNFPSELHIAKIALEAL